MPPLLAAQDAIGRFVPASRCVLVVRMDDGQMVWANDVFCDLIGHPPEAVASMTLEGLHDEFELEFIEQRHRLTRGLADDGEVRLRRAGGGELWPRFYAVPHPLELQRRSCAAIRVESATPACPSTAAGRRAP